TTLPPTSLAAPTEIALIEIDFARSLYRSLKASTWPFVGAECVVLDVFLPIEEGAAMGDDAAKSIVTAFNDCIGRTDITGLSSLMTDDHVFIDTTQNSILGKNCCLEAWKSFFAAFPNYRNIFERVLIVGDHVVMAGDSVCAARRLVGPALWTAKLSGTLVAEWWVYEDTPANRAISGLAE